MLGLQYTEMALKHWKEFLPERTKSMQEEGTLNEWAQKASKLASEQVAGLMSHGMQKNEAEELVLPETVLLPPEK